MVPIKKSRLGRPPSVESKVTAEIKELRSVLEALSAAVKGLADRAPECPHHFVGDDQHHTKNLGNFESFGYGFSLMTPVSWVPEDDVEKEETRHKLKAKAEAISHFLSEMMNEVSQAIDKSRGS